MGMVEYTTNFFSVENMNQVATWNESIGWYMNSYYYRFHDVQVTIESGSKPCTVSLARNGPNYTMGPCGKYHSLPDLFLVRSE